MAVKINVASVAVIGAGVSGVSAAAHLLKNGLEVVLFERASIAGGVWHFDSRSAPDPSFPNEKPSAGDYTFSPETAYETPPPEEEDGGAFEIAHAPPSPCYAGLMNNVSTPLMRTSLGAWPEGTADFVSQKVLEEYIQSLAEVTGVNKVTKYNTRVEEVWKQGDTWKLRTTTLEKTTNRQRLRESHWAFDAVVVASGHYNMPRVPDMRGLSTWKQLWPGRVRHSKSYRRPTEFKNKTILLIGAGVSSCDIAREAGEYAKHIFQSSRGGVLDLPASFLPSNASRIGAVKSFDLTRSEQHMGEENHIPASITLEDGSKLCGIDYVILCTGYITSYPFLRQLHSDTTPKSEASDEILVTQEGDMVHNLWKDIFYIPDPTLAFVGVPYHIATFSLFDFQAQTIARTFANKARLPDTRIMRLEYQQRVMTKGLGRDFHSLRGQGDEQAYVEDLVNWMNKDALLYGVDEMIGHTEEWFTANLAREEKLRWLRASKDQQAEASKYNGKLETLC
ncbi:hypothetical protein LTR47_008582 [Exophiala xenobiotica]|nr:hypothetical protein LTR47_008582 [Exophiala xenobiotica]KAK5244180.1 hypothetical protein LTS06_010192 [Exophiala xenobiotica]KAK5347269.1 hypothetical protein LTR61_009152 [Exophiala xenobiotica]KAK5358117.1 hypothetical protein LTS03_011371 [Exophiala xenobiotica]KAK5362125.1 hypothetical protein LTR11_009515 [Exophiala xenobiotica]